MNFYELEAQMKTFEVLSSPIPPDTYIILHVDGDNFHNFVEKMNYERPFDFKFHDVMRELGEYLMRNLKTTYAYHQSDEISVLLSLNYNDFNRDLVKLVSKSVSLATKFFTLRIRNEAGFAVHVYSLPNISRVIDYFRWRMQDCFRNCFNTWCFWNEVKKGKSKRVATKMFDGWNQGKKIQYLYDEGIQDIPEWQKFGTGLYWEDYLKEAFNPITKEKVLAERRKVIVNNNLPNGEEYKKFILRLLDNEETRT